VQAVLDDVHISMVKRFAAQPVVTADGISECLEQVRRVMDTSHKLYVRFVRSALRSGEISPPYPFESKDMVDGTLLGARERMEELLLLPPRHIDKVTIDKVFQQVPGLLTRLRNY
jgi:hypothetical protein